MASRAVNVCSPLTMRTSFPVSPRAFLIIGRRRQEGERFALALRCCLPSRSHRRIFVRFNSFRPSFAGGAEGTGFRGTIPRDVYSWNQTLYSVGRREGVARARELFDRMPERDIVTYTSMISLYLKDGNLPLAEALFRQLPCRNVVVESAMIHGYARAGRMEEARRVFDAMVDRNVVSWTSLLSGYCRMGRLDKAREIFDQMPVRNVVSWTTILLGYARCGLLAEARELFYQMPGRNVVAWTAMIKACIENGQIAEARDLFDAMPNRNVYSWNVMISGYLSNKQEDEAISLFHSMPYKNAVSWTTMVTGLAQNRWMGRAWDFFDQMPEKDTAAWNAMISAYVDEGLIVAARKLFNSMPERNTVSWNVMIDAYVKNGCRDEASGLFLLLLHSPTKWNETTLTSMLAACDVNAEVKEIHGLATKVGFDSDTSLVNALVTMYSRSGDLDSAWLAFKGLDHKDVISWTSIILAYSNHGHGGHALQAFTQMLKQKIKPDEIAFIGVISACSHMGLVEKGKRIFDSMEQAYALKPKAEHYSCLVDLLGRAGQIEEAEALVRDIPENERDGVVLGALLGACVAHDKIEVARQVGEELIGLCPLGSGSYVLLANAYASQGKWNCAARMRKMMKERNVKKVPGFSQIEVHMKNHLFYAGDQSHPNVTEIYSLLRDNLFPQMKAIKLFEIDDHLPI